METTHFKELLNLVDYFNHKEYKELNKLNDNDYKDKRNEIFGENQNENTILISELSKKIIQLDFDYSILKNNFELEIENNLSNAPNIDSKKFIIKYYLNEVKKVDYILFLYSELITKNINYDTINDFDKYVYSCGLLYFIMFNKIYELCKISDMNYHSLINDLEINDCFNFDNVNEINEPEPITPIEAAKTQQIMLMYELGIFDYLIATNPELTVNGTVNYNKLAQTISVFTGIKADTIRQTYNIFIGNKPNKNPFDVENNKVWLSNTLSELGIKKIK